MTLSRCPGGKSGCGRVTSRPPLSLDPPPPPPVGSKSMAVAQEAERWAVRPHARCRVETGQPSSPGPTYWGRIETVGSKSMAAAGPTCPTWSLNKTRPARQASRRRLPTAQRRPPARDRPSLWAVWRWRGAPRRARWRAAQVLLAVPPYKTSPLPAVHHRKRPFRRAPSSAPLCPSACPRQPHKRAGLASKSASPMSCLMSRSADRPGPTRRPLQNKPFLPERGRKTACFRSPWVPGVDTLPVLYRSPR